MPWRELLIFLSCPSTKRLREILSRFCNLQKKKLGNVIDQLDSCVPQTLKSQTCEIYHAEKRALEVARSVVTNVGQVGVVEKAEEMEKTLYSKSEPSASNLYKKYEPVVEKCCMFTWYKICGFPFVPQLVEVLILPIVYCVEKYNYGVQYLDEVEYSVAAFLPIVPVENIKSIIYRELKRKE